MNVFEKLIDQHKQIERELLELEEIIEAETINYGNLLNVKKKLKEIWNLHEEKEEKVFEILNKEKMNIKIEKFLTEHRFFKKNWEKLEEAIEERKEGKLKEVLNSDGKEIITKIRSHIEAENIFFYSVTWDLLNDKTKEKLERVWKYYLESNL